jgi:multicomponent Na+:H+ antiporter subunit G
MTVLSVLLISVGVGFLGVSALGVVRLPDFFSRAHAVAKSETLGIMLVLSGLVVHNRFGPGSLQLLLVVVIALLANPTAVHALARAARRDAAASGPAQPLPEWKSKEAP